MLLQVLASLIHQQHIRNDSLQSQRYLTGLTGSVKQVAFYLNSKSLTCQSFLPSGSTVFSSGLALVCVLGLSTARRFSTSLIASSICLCSCSSRMKMCSFTGGGKDWERSLSGWRDVVSGGEEREHGYGAGHGGGFWGRCLPPVFASRFYHIDFERQ